MAWFLMKTDRANYINGRKLSASQAWFESPRQVVAILPRML